MFSQNWIKEHDGFVGFVDNETLSIPENLSKNKNQEFELYQVHAYPATKEIINSAAESSRRGHKAWSSLSASQRSKYLMR